MPDPGDNEFAHGTNHSNLKGDAEAGNWERVCVCGGGGGVAGCVWDKFPERALAFRKEHWPISVPSQCLCHCKPRLRNFSLKRNWIFDEQLLVVAPGISMLKSFCSAEVVIFFVVRVPHQLRSTKIVDKIKVKEGEKVA